MTTIVIPSGAICWNVNYVQFWIGARRCPRRNIPCICPRITLPSVMTKLPRFRNYMKNPHLFSCANIISPDMPWNIFLLLGIITTSMCIAHYNDIIDNDWRRSMCNQSIFWINSMYRVNIISQPDLKINNTILSKLQNGASCSRINEGHIITRCNNNYFPFTIYFRICESPA